MRERESEREREKNGEGEMMEKERRCSIQSVYQDYSTLYLC